MNSLLLQYCVFISLGLLLNIPADSQTPATPGACYATTGFADGGRLLTIDPATGAATLIGDIPGLTRVPGLAINSNGDLYVTEGGGLQSSLYRVDAATAAATLIGHTNLPFVDGIAFGVNDVLYAAAFDGNLYTINVNTAAPTLVGAIGINIIVGLAFDPTNGTLYGTTGNFGGFGDRLYTINTTTGLGTLVGMTGVGGATPDIFFDPAGNLFGSKSGGFGGPGLISIDKTTGAGVVIGPTGFLSVSGLACAIAAPIPTMSEWALIILALMLMAIGTVILRQKDRQFSYS